MIIIIASASICFISVINSVIMKNFTNYNLNKSKLIKLCYVSFKFHQSICINQYQKEY